MAHAEELEENYERIKRDMTAEVKVALIGQPGAGKSSLINELVGKEIFEVDTRTDTTISKQEKNLGNGLIIVDLPGYGTRRFPIETWLNQFQPEQFDLYLFVFDGKLHDSDSTLFQNLKKWRAEREHPFFIVRNKEDDIYQRGKTLDELKADIRKDVCSRIGNNSEKIYFTCCREDRGIKGIDDLKNDIFSANISSIKKSKLMAEFKASSIRDLVAKKSICLDELDYYAWAGALNGLNPIPGVNIAVDVGMIAKMFFRFRDIFGIDDNVKAILSVLGTTNAIKAIPIAERIFQFASEEGIKFLLKQFGSRELKKTVIQYIPIIGWVISAEMGYNLIKEIGTLYMNDCYEVAKAELEYFVKSRK